ncbi:MAG: hypothetical protein JRH15_14990 [Deltaproteobacteria bacterium]|nr:hypothetical protein [Deltaproteobacteria bacterium]
MSDEKAKREIDEEGLCLMEEEVHALNADLLEKKADLEHYHYEVDIIRKELNKTRLKVQTDLQTAIREEEEIKGLLQLASRAKSAWNEYLHCKEETKRLTAERDKSYKRQEAIRLVFNTS